jgi:hypothetical protein
MELSRAGDCYLAVRGGVVKYGPSGAQEWFRPLGDSTTEISPVALALGSGDVVYVTAPGYVSNALQILTFALSSAGERLWTAYAASSIPWGNVADPRDVQVDSAGNVYVCGHDYGDVFLVKYSAQGALLWTRTYPNFNLDIGEAMTIDAPGNVCIVASSWFLELYTWVMTLKYNGSGDLLWSGTHQTGTFFPAPYYAIATDASNNVVVGTTGRRYDQAHDYLVIKYRADGMPTWTNSYTGPAGDDTLVDVAVDQQGNVYATGVSAAVQDHMTTLRFGPDGGRHWTARDQPFIQSASGSSPVGIIVHEDGHVYVGGHAITTYGQDFIVHKYATNGTLLWSVPVHNAAYGTADICRDIEMDDDGAIYLTGQSSQLSGEAEVFTVKLQQTMLTNWPTIIEPPRSVTIVVGQSPQVAFSVSASSESPLRFQWRFNGAIIPGATNSTYLISNVTKQDEGGYSVIVSNDFGRVVSAEATLEVNIPPSILSQSGDQTVSVDRVTGFSVEATGDLPLFYQWQFNGENIPNATNRWIDFNPVRMEHAGVYRVVVSNAFGVVVSAPMTLTVTPRMRLDRWTWRHPIPTNSVEPNLHAITEGENRLVAVGNLGTILLSFDGTAWTNVQSSAQTELRGVAYGRDIFVAVGFAGTLMTSRDGFSWEALRVVTNDLYGVAFVNDRFIAVGEAGIIVTSTNGLDWFAPRSASTLRLKGITYGAGLYIATGRNGTFARSYDATNWIATSNEQWGYVKGIAFTSGLFRAVAPNGVLTSTNGTNWNSWSFGGWPEFENILPVEGQHLVVGQQGLLMTLLPDSRSIAQLTVTRKTIRDAIYARGCVWAVGNDGLIIQSGQLRPYVRISEAGPSGATLNIRAEPGESVRIEASSDLRDWQPLGAVVGEENPVLYRDNAAGRSRFYRLQD